MRRSPTIRLRTLLGYAGRIAGEQVLAVQVDATTWLCTGRLSVALTDPMGLGHLTARPGWCTVEYDGIQSPPGLPLPGTAARLDATARSIRDALAEPYRERIHSTAWSMREGDNGGRYRLWNAGGRAVLLPDAATRPWQAARHTVQFAAAGHDTAITASLDEVVVGLITPAPHPARWPTFPARLARRLAEQADTPT